MLDLEFKKLSNINRPQSVHGIYPYRGKISSVEATVITQQLRKNSTLLDPFCGSGTIIFEGLMNGLNVIGVDSNPLAEIVSRGKLGSLMKELNEFNNEVDKCISDSRNTKMTIMPILIKKHFHQKTAMEIMSLVPYFNNMSDYLKSAFVGAIALSARGCNDYKWTSSTVGKDINPKRYINFYDKFRYKVSKHYPGKFDLSLRSEAILGDSRELSKLIKTNSVDFVFTSPPYFDCLDYTSYYGKIVLDILGFDRKEIKKSLIQTTKSYKEDMRKVMNEIIKVTKKDAIIIFVVGDKKIGNELIKGSEIFSELLEHKPTKVIEREYTNSSSQVFDRLNKTKRKEQIIIWDKGTW